LKVAKFYLKHHPELIAKEESEEEEEVNHHHRGGYQNNSNQKNYQHDSRSFDFNRYNNAWQNQNQNQYHQYNRNSHSYSNGYDFQNKFQHQRRENSCHQFPSNNQDSWKQRQDKVSTDRRSNISSAKSEINNTRSPLPIAHTHTPTSVSNNQPLFNQLLPATQNNNNNNNGTAQRPFDFNIQNLKNTLSFYSNKVSALTNKAKGNQK
jgi:hypothetical protein